MFSKALGICLFTIAVNLLAIVPATVAKYATIPQYSFSYSVSDQTTGDNKHQSESRDGDVVRGQYSMIEPDGSRRTIEYISSPVNGFNAFASKEPAAEVKVAHTT